MIDAKTKLYAYFKVLPTDCWEWQAKVNKRTGYGQLGVNYKTLLAHRVSYEIHKGKIPGGLTIDHLCKNRICINPFHLEAVTLRENILRGNSLSAINARKIYCIRRHPLRGSNLYLTPDKRRQCKICNKLRAKEYLEKKAEVCHS